MRTLFCLIVLTLATSAWSQSSQPVVTAAPSKQVINGVWWAKTEVGVRSGFINGASDCLTWTAHKKGFNATPEQIMDKIDKYYQTHPESAHLSVIDVWQKVVDDPKAGKSTLDPGETWTNAHWYLNGEWWHQIYESEQLGFVEGYLWCMKTQVSHPTESYSRSANYYCQRIDAFVSAHPKLGNEAVAVTLHRFRDKDVVTTPVQLR
jgi:hypothetical protein